MGYHDKAATYVESIQLRTDNLERAVQFYRDILGFQILEQDKAGVKLTADGKTAIVSLVQPDDIVPKQHRTAGLYHFAILLPNRSDLARLIVHLVTQGVRFGASDHLVSEAIYFDDPDGNGIEIYADTDPITWKWKAEEVRMDTLPLDFEDLLGSIGEERPSWSKMPEETIIGHIHLHVSSLEAARRFYTEGLGFDVVSRLQDSALFLSTAKYHHHIAVNTWNGVGAPPAPKNSVGLDFFTVVFPDEQSLQKAITDLEKIGAQVEETDGTVSTADPAGNTIVLTVH